MISRIAASLCATLALAMPVLGQTAGYVVTPLSTPDVIAPSVAPAAIIEEAPVAPETWWTSADYMFGFIRRAHTPPLVTTAPAGTPQATAGVIGQAETQILFGGEFVNGDLRSGFRVNAGKWLTEDHKIGVDVGYFMTESRAQLFDASSDGSVILARPFFDVSTAPATPSAVLVAFPGVSTGSVAVSANSGSFYGAHVDLQEEVIERSNVRLKSLFGYRFLRFDDGLQVRQTAFPTTVGTIPGTQLIANDSFAAHNTFNGGEVGLQLQFFRDVWSLDFLSKLAVGNLQRNVLIDGSTIVTAPGTAPIVSSGGVLALASNIGQHTSNDWVAAPEVGVNVGWNATPNLRLRVGYSLLILYEVARAAEQVDLNINANLIPPTTVVGPGRPLFDLQRSTIWLQTLNLGAELKF